MLKIDIHTHVIPEKLPDYSRKFGYEGFVNLVKKDDSTADMVLFNENFRTIKCNCWNPSSRIEDYDNFNINVQVISPIPIMFSYWAEPKDALEVSKFINDFIASICYENPKRFIGLGTVPMQSSSLSIKELERCKNELNLPGVEIGSNINDINLSDIKRYNKFLIIYRNKKNIVNTEDLFNFRKRCRLRRIRFFVANNIKLAIKLKADGVYLSSKNNDFKALNVRKDNFSIMGSAHNLKEINLKEKQNCKYILLSKLFTVNYDKKSPTLGLIKFNKLK